MVHVGAHTAVFFGDAVAQHEEMKFLFRKIKSYTDVIYCICAMFLRRNECVSGPVERTLRFWQYPTVSGDVPNFRRLPKSDGVVVI